MDIGKAIQKLRKAKGFTQLELAEAIGITQTALSQIENKRRPDEETLKKICCVLDVPRIVIYIEAMDKEEVSPGKKELYDILWPVIVDLLKKLV